MRFKRLFILVEGEDDERFFERVLKRQLEARYDSVSVWKYAEQKPEKIRRLLASIEAMGAEYVYWADLHGAPCVTARKEKSQAESRFLAKDRILVVAQEIESWYVSGLGAEDARRLGISHCRVTDGVTKQQFDGWIPKRFDSRVDFMLETLKRFDVKMAIRRNASFRYFLEKYGGLP